MAIALLATIVLVEPTPKPAHKTSLSAPLRALRHRSLLTMSLTALCYNWGFFTVLGYAPFPMKLSPIELGLVFTGWGILVAIFAVFGAPRLQASLGIARTMYLNLFAFAVVVLVIAIWTTDRAVLIPAVIVSRRERWLSGSGCWPPGTRCWLRPSGSRPRSCRAPPPSGRKKRRWRWPTARRAEVSRA
jgi:ACDE family multidrug resistance protein